MPRKPSLTVEEDKIVRTLYLEGHGAPHIAKELGVKTGIISSSIKRQKIGRTCSEAARKYHFDEQFFKTIDTQEKAYWLGFIYADGYVSSSTSYSYSIGISLAIKDKTHLNKFVKFINGNVPVKDYLQNNAYKANTKYSKLLLSSRMMYDDLVRQGVIEHKTDKLKWPNNLPINLENHFIRGYFDGNGCLTHVNRKRKKSKILFHDYAIKILSTEDFLTELYKRIKQTGITTPLKFYKRKTFQTVSSLEISGNCNVEKVLTYMYKDATFYLDRKYEKYKEFMNYLHSRATSKEIA